MKNFLKVSEEPTLALVGVFWKWSGILHRLILRPPVREKTVPVEEFVSSHRVLSPTPSPVQVTVSVTETRFPIFTNKSPFNLFKRTPSRVNV